MAGRSTVGGLLRWHVRRTEVNDSNMRVDSQPRWFVKTKDEDEFELVERVNELRTLLRHMIRFFPNERMTCLIEIDRISWQEAGGRVASTKNSFTVDIDARGRVDRLYKSIPLTETWEDDPERVDEAAETVGNVIFTAIERMASSLRRES